MTNIDMEKQPLLEAEAQPTASGFSSAPEEPTLSELQQRVFTAQREYMRAWSRTTSGKWHKRVMLGVTAILLLFVAFCFTVIVQDSLSDEPWATGPTKVALEAHIMSKCPDARDCLRDMILPAMQNVSRMVDFKLSYIGTVEANGTDDEEVTCKHGPEECVGNIIELCAAKHYPNPRVYLGFVMCLSRDFSKIPSRELVQGCALEHGISIDTLNSCAVDEDGYPSLDLLKESVTRTADAGVTKSCTVRVDNEIRCIRDDGQWKDCPGGSSAEDLVREITQKYEELEGW